MENLDGQMARHDFTHLVQRAHKAVGEFLFCNTCKRPTGHTTGKDGGD